MTQATMSFKTDPSLKSRYETFAHEHGVTPSALLNIQMRQLQKTKRLVIGSEALDEDFSDKQIQELQTSKEHKKLWKSLENKFGGGK